MSARTEIASGRLVYTCKCGWIDTGHANPKRSARPHIGAISLWDQIVNETGLASKFPDTKGFQVVYGQDALVSVFGFHMYPGLFRRYLVQPGLSRQAKEAVALAIFQEVSYGFESRQGLAVWSDSSFSVEDLVSDLIGFYTAVRPQIDYLRLCEPVSKDASYKVWDTFGPVGSTKNKTFEPVFFDCDECRSKGPFPQELQRIKPATKGADFRDWLDLDDWPGGIPPIRGAKY
jgi:hypothetical protein